MRFARAKGSKASNERVPESATSWNDMKNDLIKKNEENVLQAGQSNYTAKTFNNVQKQAKVVKWSEFPFDDQQIKKHKLKTKKTGSLENQKKNVEELQCPLTNHKVKTKKTKSLENQKKSVEELEPPPVGNKLKTKKTKSLENQKKSVEELEPPPPPVGHKLNRKKTETSEYQKKAIEELEFPLVVQKKRKRKQLKKEETGNFSSTSNTKAGEMKSFNKKGNFGEHKRRKPIDEVNKIYINGNEIELSYYDGYPIKKIDAERLKELKKEMISRGVPKRDVMITLKLERRKAEKSLAREKKKVCFNCRKSGHTLSECPALKSGPDAQMSETGICFKCGSTEHTHFQCRVTRGDNFQFAQCFICKEQGHIARQCPDNNKGLYPKGGACRICGDVTHLKRDCPQYQFEQEENQIVAHTIDDHNIESLENETKTVGKKLQSSQKIIKF